MTKEKKIKKIIEIAKKRGWVGNIVWDDYYGQPAIPCNGAYEGTFPEAFIFSHDFLKAYFGEERIVAGKNNLLDEPFSGPISWDGPKWGWHAQQLVLAEDRIEYLWENRPKEVI